MAGSVVVLLAATPAWALDLDPIGLGTRVAALGDVDGDGKGDFAAATASSRPKVHVVSGATRKVLWTRDGYDAAAVPDETGDGRPEVVVGCTTRSEDGVWCEVVDGASGAVVRTLVPPEGTEKFTFRGASTQSVSLAGDVDGDGRPELLVLRATPPGRPVPGYDSWCDEAALLLLSLDGKTATPVDAQIDRNYREFIATPAGDLDGDGKADLFLRGDWKRGSGKLPVRVIAPPGRVVLEFTGDYLRTPDSVAPLGDVNGDGRTDYLFGQEFAKRGASDFAGEIRVVSGKDGKTIRTAKGKKEGDGLGAAAASIGDADGDGVPDFVGGAPGVDAKKDAKNDFGLSGAVMAFSGKTAKPLWTTTGTDYSQRLGIAVAAIGDVDGDGVSDVAAGAPAFGAGAGQVFVISGKSGQVLGTVREGD